MKGVILLIPITSTILAYDHFLEDGLFKDAIFPAGIDKQLVIETILNNAGEFEPLYKNAEYMQIQTAVWARKWYDTFSRWDLALSTDYDPLHNYDRHEIVKELHDDQTTSDMNSTTTGKDVSTNTRSAYDSNGYEPHDRNDLDSSGNSINKAAGTDKGRFDREAHMYGNIGVTTSATMLTEEMEVRGKFNLYNMIADCFANELCILLY